MNVFPSFLFLGRNKNIPDHHVSSAKYFDWWRLPIIDSFIYETLTTEMLSSDRRATGLLRRGLNSKSGPSPNAIRIF